MHLSCGVIQLFEKFSCLTMNELATVQDSALTDSKDNVLQKGETLLRCQLFCIHEAP
jgi:hypothetical protein